METRVAAEENARSTADTSLDTRITGVVAEFKNIAQIAGKTLSNADEHHIVANASGQTFVLPAAPSEGDFWFIKNHHSNDATCVVSGNGKLIDGQASITLDIPNGAVKVVYDSGVGQWFVF
jgi:hypothetical protein